MKRLIAALVSMTLLLTPTAIFARFSDLDSVPWATDSINELSDKGIINGYEDGSFKPGSNVTRAEFATLLCLAFDANASTNDSFYNINHWAKEYIVRTSDLVYNPYKTYMPDRYATRGEIAYALTNALKLPAPTEDAGEKFADWDKVNPDIASKLASAAEHGIIKGYETGEIRAQGEVTRAEAAVLIDRALEYKEVHQDKEENLPQDKPSDEENDETNKKPDIFEGLDHIYTLYPLEKLLVVSSVSKTFSEKTGNEAYRLTYRIAGESDKEYSSVIDDESITVFGTKASLSEISAGDVLTVDMVLLTHIKSIIVLASLDDGFSGDASMVIPVGSKTGFYGSDTDYEFIYGDLVDKKINTRTVSLTVHNDEGTFTVNVPRALEADRYTDGRKNVWDTEKVSSLDAGEDRVYIRFTENKATEVIAVKK